MSFCLCRTFLVRRFTQISIMKKILLICLMLVASANLTQAQVVYADAARPDNTGDGTSWATAKKELQSAIAQATSGQQVWVKAGTYKPTLGIDRNISFSMKNDVAIYGGFTGTETLLEQRNEIYNLTILSGDLNGDDVGFTNNGENSIHVVNNISINSTAILDGFTITKGNANSGTYNSGGGMLNNNASPTIKNCLFLSNAGTDYAGGMFILGTSSPVLNNCVFDGNSHGAVCIISATFTASNCIFNNNSGEAAVTSLQGNAFLYNCTITSNGVAGSLGGIFGSVANIIVQNCIFYNNTADVTTGLLDIYAADLSSASIANSFMYDGYGGAGVIQSNINQFVNLSNAIGPDNLWRTADDGLRLVCGILAINTGASSTACAANIPTTDILGITRNGNPDMGAYEGGFADHAVNSIASANSTILFDQNATGTTNYATCDKLVASVSSSGSYTVAGSVTAKVWIEATQPAEYVKRHYEITPGVDPTTATGKVTLYFTQQEFDDFNGANSTQLPKDPSDIEGNIPNLRIEKRSGISSDGTGLPNTYPTGTPETFAPSAANGGVVWNGAASRWEVSFEVTGFSGFFVKTIQTALPLRLMGFSGTQETATNKLQWQTADEVNTKSFELESSKDGRNFQKVATIDAVSTGNNSYHYTDATVYKGILYYRLKMIDIDGTFTYSRILGLSRDGKGTINLYPNPVADLLTLSLDNSLINSEAKLYDTSGKLLQTIKIASAEELINVKTLPTGVYIIKFKDGSVGSFLKE
jgi:hypothetical protein